MSEPEAIDKAPGSEVTVAVRPSAGGSDGFTYLLVPGIFLLVTLLGGFRLGAADNAFIFFVPPLICLVFGTMTLLLFARSRLIAIDGWLSPGRGVLANAANAAVLLSFFTATIQLYNSLMPEQGPAFWVIGFCFVWVLWNYLFAGLDARRLVKSLSAMFGLAFAVKYLLLASLTPDPTAGNWLQRILQNPGQEAMTWLLDIPRYSAGTGYLQFFTLGFYLVGVYLLPRRPNGEA